MAYIGHAEMTAGPPWSLLCCTVWNCFLVSWRRNTAGLFNVYKQFPLNFRSERQPHFTHLHPYSFTKQLANWLRMPVREFEERKPMVSFSSECSVKGECKATARWRKSALRLCWLVLGKSIAAKLSPSLLQHNVRTRIMKVCMWPDWRKFSRTLKTQR